MPAGFLWMTVFATTNLYFDLSTAFGPALARLTGACEPDAVERRTDMLPTDLTVARGAS